MSGIKKRWVRNYIFIISLISLFVVAGFLFTIQKFYYNLAYESLYNRLNISASFYTKYMSERSLSLDETSQLMLRDYQDDKIAELQILDRNGVMVYSSAGFIDKKKILSQDVLDAISGRQGYWVGKNEGTDESVMAVTAPILDKKLSMIGVLRYVSSISKLNHIIYNYLMYALIVVAVIVLILMVLSITFSRSILTPINEITLVSQKMSEGNFDEKVPVIYKDELGVLAQTLNLMADEIQKAERLKNDFISSISHEIRTPLTAVSGWAETILTGDLSNTDEVEFGLNIIVRETGRLSDMVEELLDFSRIQSGRLTLRKEEFDLVTEVSDIVRIFRAKAKQRRIKIMLPNYFSPVYVYADMNRMRQVIINVLDNAMKFSNDEGIVYIEIGNIMDVDNKENKEVYISIRDEGVGISDSDIDNVTNKFYKGDSCRSGSGIGLAISNEIMQLHGGRLNIVSTLGEGTTVNLIIPLTIDKKNNKKNNKKKFNNSKFT